MLTFGAESPRQQIDSAFIDLYRDDQGFVVAHVKIPAREAEFILRLGQPTARALGEAMRKMALSEVPNEPS